MSETGPSEPGSLLLAVSSDFTVRLGLPPKDRLDSFQTKSFTVGKLNNARCIACSPDGELYCICDSDLYRGPVPTNKDVDWCSVASRVGKHEWSKFKLIVFHPNGEMYGTTHDGNFYKGLPPDHENVSWIHGRAKLIGTHDWYKCEALSFDPQGVLYAVTSEDRIVKGKPPSQPMEWFKAATTVGDGGWKKLSHFMAFTPDGKLWCVDKDNGNLFRGPPPTPETNYALTAEYIGWKYNSYSLFAFTNVKVVHKILSLSFLPDQGKRLSENTEVVEEKIYDNRSNSSPLKDRFSFSRVIKDLSSFTLQCGYIFEDGVDISFKTGMPLITAGGSTVTMTTSLTKNWNLTQVNEMETPFSSSIDVEVAPGKAIRMMASLMKAEHNIPYRAKILTLFGSKMEIEGMWKGVIHCNLTLTQEDYGS